MSCYKPLLAVDRGYDENGKRDFKIYPNGSIASDGFRDDVRFFEIPCGHCIGCRQDQSKEWANRLIMESLYHEASYFLTLTYCEEYISYRTVRSVDLTTGEAVWKTSLCKKDFQGFMKRLRECFPNRKLRYYAAGEYGDQTDRCHFHAIIFGLPKSKELGLKFAGVSETGNIYSRCKVIEQCWCATKNSDFPLGLNRNDTDFNGNLLGWCSIESANYYTMKYVSSYVTKKLGSYPDQMYRLEGREPPFSLSSRRPGIGLQYLFDHPKDMEDDKIIIGSPTGKIEFPPPRYFKKKLAEYDPGLYDELVQKHIKQKIDKEKGELSKTDVSRDEYLKIKESNHLSRQKQRNKI